MTNGRSLPESTLVGRQCELDHILHLFDESRTSRLRVVLVAGEPGIGKTRLLQEDGGREKLWGE